MDQLVNVLLAIASKAHIVPQRALDSGPELGGFMCPTDPLPLFRVSVSIRRIFRAGII